MACVLNFKTTPCSPSPDLAPGLWMARLFVQIRKSESLESFIGHSLLPVFHMWSVVKSCRFHHPSACQSCLHFSLSTSISQTLSSLHFSWSPDHRSTSPLVRTHPLHPQDPAIFSRGRSDLVTAAPHFSAQSPYVGFHWSVVRFTSVIHVVASSSTCSSGLTHTPWSPELSSKADPHLSPLRTFCSLWWTAFLPLVPG